MKKAAPTNVIVLDRSYLEATGIDRILQQTDFEVKTEHYLEAEPLHQRLKQGFISVVFIDTSTLNGELENVTRAVKKRQPHTYVIWLSPEEDELMTFDAICACAD